jgi:DNA-binding beta-propeller fold protein YncE
MKQNKYSSVCEACLGTLLLISVSVSALAIDDDDDATPQSKLQRMVLPSGQIVTPTAIPRSVLEFLNPNLADAPAFVPSGAMTTIVSPDKKTLLVLTSGYNLTSDSSGNSIADASEQYVFVYDISADKPAKRQVLEIPNTYAGIAFSPSGQTFYVGGGQDDDIHSFGVQAGGTWAEVGSPIKLGHSTAIALAPGLIPPSTGGLAVTADGSRIVITNFYNDSITIVDVASRSIVKELDLRPGKVDSAKAGVPGGEYPFWVAIKGNDTVYVSSIRDRQIVIASLGANPAVVKYIPVSGSPNKLILNKAETLLFAAADFTDTVDVLDTTTDKVVETISTTAPQGWISEKTREFRGSMPNSLALSPDESTLYVTNGGTNSVAVISIEPGRSRVVGLLPTSLYPCSVSVSGDGKWLYVVSGKSKTGPNPLETQASANQYVLQLHKSTLLGFPLPSQWELEALTHVVAENNRFSSDRQFRDEFVFDRLRERVKHVIYIVKENRTYDQILGDLDRGNGDPSLTQFGEQVTPNFHKIARKFVDLDNFYDPGDVSSNGWPWSTAGRESDFGLKSVPVNYAGRGLNYESEGTNRDINVGLPTSLARETFDPISPSDPDILPGTADVTAPDAPGENGTPGKGYLWDAALRAGLTIRDYGFFCDLARYDTRNPALVPLERNPAQKGLQVAFPTKPELIANFDPYFRGFDNAFPDFYREVEWAREFDQFDQTGDLPALSLVRLMHDHMGNFDTAIDGVNTPELQQADNDYAVARLIDKVAHSRYKYDTLVFVVEDDAQDGADHVDSHRSTAYIVGPYVWHGAVVSRRFSTVNMLRTIEEILGLDHLNLFTATARPMTDVFDLDQREWTFDADPSALLVANTALPIAKSDTASLGGPRPTHDAQYWAQKTAEFDFHKEDNLKDPQKFNRIIWAGLKSDIPYPAARSGADLRRNRRQLLKKAALVAAEVNPLDKREMQH